MNWQLLPALFCSPLILLQCHRKVPQCSSFAMSLCIVLTTLFVDSMLFERPLLSLAAIAIVGLMIFVNRLSKAHYTGTGEPQWPEVRFVIFTMAVIAAIPALPLVYLFLSNGSYNELTDVLEILVILVTLVLVLAGFLLAGRRKAVFAASIYISVVISLSLMVWMGFEAVRYGVQLSWELTGITAIITIMTGIGLVWIFSLFICLSLLVMRVAGKKKNDATAIAEPNTVFPVLRTAGLTLVSLAAISPLFILMYGSAGLDLDVPQVNEPVRDYRAAYLRFQAPASMRVTEWTLLIPPDPMTALNSFTDTNRWLHMREYMYGHSKAAAAEDFERICRNSPASNSGKKIKGLIRERLDEDLAQPACINLVLYSDSPLVDVEAFLGFEDGYVHLTSSTNQEGDDWLDALTNSRDLSVGRLKGFLNYYQWTGENNGVTDGFNYYSRYGVIKQAWKKARPLSRIWLKDGAFNIRLDENTLHLGSDDMIFPPAIRLQALIRRLADTGQVQSTALNGKKLEGATALAVYDFVQSSDKSNRGRLSVNLNIARMADSSPAIINAHTTAEADENDLKLYLARWQAFIDSLDYQAPKMISELQLLRLSASTFTP